MEKVEFGKGTAGREIEIGGKQILNCLTSTDPPYLHFFLKTPSLLPHFVTSCWPVYCSLLQNSGTFIFITVWLWCTNTERTDRRRSEDYNNKTETTSKAKIILKYIFNILWVNELVCSFVNSNYDYDIWGHSSNSSTFTSIRNSTLIFPSSCHCTARIIIHTIFPMK